MLKLLRYLRMKWAFKRLTPEYQKLMRAMGCAPDTAKPTLTTADVLGGLAFVGFMLGLTACLLWDEGWDLLCLLVGC